MKLYTYLLITDYIHKEMIFKMHLLRKVFTWIYFFTLFVLSSSVCWAGSSQSIVSEFACNDAKVTIVSVCDKESFGPFPFCTQQNITLSKQGKKIPIKADGKLTPEHDRNGKITAHLLDAVVSGIACVKGKDKDYILMSYYTGGNCEQCEWYNIYDLDGHRLAGGSSRGAKKKFSSIYKKLGLPEAWPEDKFKRIKYPQKNNRTLRG